eukprot:TRINITY_DN93666_c0_g1_i1.p1 TRINITY_DN93666_c0_g1~~TRINITY_DN93666_c0_g1_i1.p1  ORF type:complete len:334 (-),score=74.01 TRINITY_DN93666_c0_g1_i1:94-1095(-)
MNSAEKKPSLLQEGAYLMKKTARHQRKPLEAIAAAFLATMAFSLSFYCLAFELRYESVAKAVLVGPVFCCILAAAFGTLAVRNFRKDGVAQGLMVCAAGLFVGAVAGGILGDRAWYQYTVNYFNYQDMASYVNVDPGVDQGQAYMDAGYVYFKESTYVLRKKAMAFHNGATYCVAPIVRQPVQVVPGQPSTGMETVTGFVPPRSGTLDFWAVGTDCCGTSGTDEPFTCGDASSKLARSGMRVLSNEARNMYLLAVQEWSATTGLPVRHPIFFTWVKDPVAKEKQFYSEAWEDLIVDTMLASVAAMVLSFSLQTVLMRFKWRSQNDDFFMHQRY